MPYTAPGITVNQQSPQAQATLATSNVRTIGAIFTAPYGPDMPVRLDPTQLVATYGDPSNPANGGYTGPALLRMIAQQIATNKASSIQVVGMRAGVKRASANITGTTGTAQIWAVNMGGTAAGTFTLTYNGQTTPAQAYNVATATLQTALQALSTVGAGNMTVSGTAGTNYIITACWDQNLCFPS